ncbi:MAG: hypothetical protein LBU80_02125 [Rikenellaceae bacterium]|jgi:beta-galactosidase|nr:hypothetical protein [Rikenellaceae bacterium]
MKKGFLLSAVWLTVTAGWGQNIESAWSDPATPAINRPASRTRFIAYNRREDAETFSFEKSPFYLSLNGAWNGENGRSTRFPGHWATASADEMKGLQPPALPAENPVARFSKTIDVPVLWLDRAVFVHIGGLQPGGTLYVNGRAAGYSEDSGAPVEFDISEYITDGQNTLTLEFHKWTTGAWLENNLLTGSGVVGEVYVYSQPKIHIQDFQISATLDSTLARGVFAIDIIATNGFNNTEKAQFWFDLEDAQGKVVKYSYKEIEIAGRSCDTIRFEYPVGAVKAWSAESPNLYQVILRTNYGGRFREYIPFKVGFRQLDYRKGNWCINGKPIVFKGVNYTTTAVATDEKMMRDDLLHLKRANVNAIRVGYHPMKARLQELCNELGLYVCDEANLDSSLTGESLAVGGTLGNNPAWLKSHLFRVENSVQASRNYPCVVMRSLGGRAGEGYNIYRAYGRMKELESLLPVAYEQAKNHWNTDVFFPADPSEEVMENWEANADTRIFLYSDLSKEGSATIMKLQNNRRTAHKFQGGFMSAPDDEALKSFYGKPAY